MNATTLSTRRQLHPPQQMCVAAARRAGVLDRLAVGLGVVLIKWGRRPLPMGRVDSRESLVQQHRARLSEERPLHQGMPLW